MKKIVTILFSLAVGALVIAMGAAVFLPSTKRARIDPLHRASDAGEETAPATQPEARPRNLPGSKSGLAVDDETMRRMLEARESVATQPDRLLPGTKVGVFDTSRPLRQHLEGSPFAPTTQPATQPATLPTTLPAGPSASQDREP